ncbi:hypothetical protein ACHAQA_008286 [Verticillium albo-atrum]
MAPAAKTNFKSYEAQARLLRAIIAAHPEVKWNYKAIVDFYGSDMSESALEHRFRVFKTHADVVRQARHQKVDCKNVPAELPKDKKEIARMFGGSTADGIQFQFRAIKQDANTLKTTVNSGGDAASALNLSTASGMSTPRGGKGSASASTPASKRSASAVSRSGASAKRTKLGPAKPTASDEGDDDDEDELDDHDAFDNDTPKASIKDRILASGRKKSAAAGPVPASASAPSPAAYPASIFNNPAAPVRAATTTAAAAAAAAARVSQQSVDLTTSDSEVNTPPPESAAAPAPSSFSSAGGAKFDTQGYGTAHAQQDVAFRQEAVDEWVGGSSEGGSYDMPSFESFSGSIFDEI